MSHSNGSLHLTHLHIKCFVRYSSWRLMYVGSSVAVYAIVQASPACIAFAEVKTRVPSSTLIRKEVRAFGTHEWLNREAESETAKAYARISRRFVRSCPLGRVPNALVSNAPISCATCSAGIGREAPVCNAFESRDAAVVSMA